MVGAQVTKSSSKFPLTHRGTCLRHDSPSSLRAWPHRPIAGSSCRLVAYSASSARGSGHWHVPSHTNLSRSRSSLQRDDTPTRIYDRVRQRPTLADDVFWLMHSP